jgi:hypothetical protein
MWGLDVFSIDKRFMDTVHLLCPHYQNLHLVVASAQRSLPKMSQSFIKMQRGKSLMLLFLISGRLRVSKIVFYFVKQFYFIDSLIRHIFRFFFFVADYDEYERSMLISQLSFEKTFGLSTVFIESTLMENGGVSESADPSMLIKEAIHVIGCGYEEKTAWGKEVRNSCSCIYFFSSFQCLVR